MHSKSEPQAPKKLPRYVRPSKTYPKRAHNVTKSRSLPPDSETCSSLQTHHRTSQHFSGRVRARAADGWHHHSFSTCVRFCGRRLCICRHQVQKRDVAVDRRRAAAHAGLRRPERRRPEPAPEASFRWWMNCEGGTAFRKGNLE